MMKIWKPDQEEIKNTENWSIWEKEISKFDWYYDESETCFILEGEAEVIDKNRNVIKFKKGDMVNFKKGLECTWNILKPMKKRYLFG